MKTKNNSSPTWGGQNWRPGEEPGTWFRHSSEHGPMVHYGTHLVILRGNRRITQQEWTTLRKESKSVAAKAVAVGKTAYTAEREARKLEVISRLENGLAHLSQVPDWDIQKNNNAGFGGGGEIRWNLYFKGIHLWTWDDVVWRQTNLSTEQLSQLGIVTGEVIAKCLAHHVASEHGSDPVQAKVTPKLIEPEKWLEGSPLEYPLQITLVGRSYDYQYRVERIGADPVFVKLEGADPQDSHAGWGFAD